MSESTHLKCPCQHCGNSIEFPVHGVGLSIDCPHCTGKTVLFIQSDGASEATSEASNTARLAPEALAGSDHAPTDPPAGRVGSKAWLVIICIGLAAATGAFLALRKKPADLQATVHSELQATSSVVAASSTTPAPSQTNGPSAAKTAKSIGDLKVGPIKLEKARGSSLVYAVGMLRNASDLQRYGVSLELELADAGGRKVGTAKDYRDVLEPRQEWRFRALVLDAKAVSASVAQIREEE